MTCTGEQKNLAGPPAQLRHDRWWTERDTGAQEELEFVLMYFWKCRVKQKALRVLRKVFFLGGESSFSPSVAKALFTRHANPTRFQGRFSTHASAGAHLRRLFLEVSLADEHRPRYGMTGMLFE